MWVAKGFELYGQGRVNPDWCETRDKSSYVFWGTKQAFRVPGLSSRKLFPGLKGYIFFCFFFYFAIVSLGQRDMTYLVGEGYNLSSFTRYGGQWFPRSPYQMCPPTRMGACWCLGFVAEEGSHEGFTSRV